VTDYICATCGLTELDIHGRCACCGSDSVTQSQNVIVAGRAGKARELTGIEKQERITLRDSSVPLPLPAGGSIRPVRRE
jgi:predicted ATP-dependent serine protease